MDIFLLGNGFDLYHSFPTKYANFLHVVQFLTESFDRNNETVGSVLGDERLHKVDSYIKDCFLKHYDAYHKTYFSYSQIEYLIEKGQTNIWFKYLLKCFNKDLGWIDFEKEIATVIEAFEEFFTSCGTYFDISVCPDSMKARYIVSQFDFFFEKVKSTTSEITNSQMQKVKQEYTIENPLGSEIFEINEEKVISELYTALRELAEMLKTYLSVFVDEPSKKMREHKRTTKNTIYSNAQRIFTFNYTNTYEILYGFIDTAEHIHGNLDGEIVLGVNPNDCDELGYLDTSFIQFKKYYQRLFLKTDESYLKALAHHYRMKNYDNGITVNVVGHSLDITDEDIIKSLFDIARNINIYYHNESAVGSYIKNLVSMYGKSKFDEIRTSKNIKFIPHDSIEWNEFCEQA